MIQLTKLLKACLLRQIPLKLDNDDIYFFPEDQSCLQSVAVLTDDDERCH